MDINRENNKQAIDTAIHEILKQKVKEGIIVSYKVIDRILPSYGEESKEETEIIITFPKNPNCHNNYSISKEYLLYRARASSTLKEAIDKWIGEAQSSMQYHQDMAEAAKGFNEDELDFLKALAEQAVIWIGSRNDEGLAEQVLKKIKLMRSIRGLHSNISYLQYEDLKR